MPPSVPACGPCRGGRRTWHRSRPRRRPAGRSSTGPWSPPCRRGGSSRIRQETFGRPRWTPTGPSWAMLLYRAISPWGRPPFSLISATRFQKMPPPSRGIPVRLSPDSCSPGGVPEAVDEVVVHHPDRLHESVADRGADETKTPGRKLPAHHTGLLGFRRQFGHRPVPVHDGGPAHEPPEICVEGPELAGHIETGTGVPDGGGDLRTVADDPRIGEEPFRFLFAVGRHPDGVEPVEGPAVILPLPENRPPGETGLGAFQHEELEQLPVVVHRHAPFLVVVRNHQRIIPGPFTAHHG